MGKWCTVTVTDSEGKRYSLDVNATSSYDAAHLYLTHVKSNPACGFPIRTTSTVFEIVTDGRSPARRRQPAEEVDRKPAPGMERPARFPVQPASAGRRLIPLFIPAGAGKYSGKTFRMP